MIANGFSLRPKNVRYMRGDATRWYCRAAAPGCRSARAPHPARRRGARAGAQSSNRPSCAAGVSSVRTTPSSRSFAPGLPGEPAAEQLRGHRGDGAPLAGRRRDGALAGEGGEVTAPDLDADAAGHELARAQPLAARSARRASSRCSTPGSPMSVLEGVLGAEGLLLDVRQHRPLVDPGGALAHPGGVAPEQRPQHRVRGAAQLPEGGDARPPRPARRSCARGPAGAAPTAGRAPRARAPAVTTVSPSGLSRSEAILATSLLGATPTEAVSPVSSRMRSLMRRAISHRRCRGARWLAVTSRKASSSDRPCTSGVTSWKTPKTVRRDLLVARHARPHAHRVRAQPQRRAHRHRRVHAEAAHLVARRRHDAAPAVPADDERLPGEAAGRRAARRMRRTHPCRRAGRRGSRPGALPRALAAATVMVIFLRSPAGCAAMWFRSPEQQLQGVLAGRQRQRASRSGPCRSAGSSRSPAAARDRSAGASVSISRWWWPVFSNLTPAGAMPMPFRPNCTRTGRVHLGAVLGADDVDLGAGRRGRALLGEGERGGESERGEDECTHGGILYTLWLEHQGAVDTGDDEHARMANTR